MLVAQLTQFCSRLTINILKMFVVVKKRTIHVALIWITCVKAKTTTCVVKLKKLFAMGSARIRTGLVVPLDKSIARPRATSVWSLTCVVILLTSSIVLPLISA